MILYNDDCEVGNALGAHAGSNKIGTIYYSIPCFPPNIASQFDNIFMAMVYYANDRKLYGNWALFETLVKELNYLSRNGIDLVVDGVTHRVYFQLALFSGDNLGLHEILGFVDNFLHGRPCRICRATASQIKKNDI